MDARLSGHDPGGPDLRAVLHHLQRVVGDVEDDIGVAERRHAEVTRQPAPALHVHEHGVDLLVALRAVDRGDGAVVEHAGGRNIGVLLEAAHGLGDLGVVVGVVGVFGDAELGAKLRHARVFHHDFRLLLALGGVYFSVGPSPIGTTGPSPWPRKLGELLLQLLVELLRRVVAVERGGGVLRRSRRWRALPPGRSDAPDTGCRPIPATSASGRSGPGAHSRACCWSASDRLRRARPAWWPRRNPAPDSRSALSPSEAASFRRAITPLALSV